MGFLAPKGWRQKYDYTRIHINSPLKSNLHLQYCWNYNFVFDKNIEEEKLYNGLPCIYTDSRYFTNYGNYFRSCYLYEQRKQPISLKSCIRRTLSCRNIPVGTEIEFRPDWYFSGKKIKTSYIFKCKKENKFDPDYQINKTSYFRNPKNEWLNTLTQALRKNGFLVGVHDNDSFLISMINTASEFVGGKKQENKEPGELIVAYGHNKIVGCSSENNPFRGYSNGCDSLLWDEFGEFDKWSRCNEILKTESINNIINTLK